MFIDRVVVECIAGKGGNGIVAWQRLKFIPKGGPGGGNGGAGGSIIVQADTQLTSLDAFRNKSQIRADNGQQGGVNQSAGKRGKDLILKVPCGTLVKDAETGDLLADLSEDKQALTICKGGRGGLGNACFKTPTNQAPNQCTPGKPGEERRIELELKLIADVGLVGFPNAGKSTLISSLAGLDVKTAAYPFTTLHPNLGFIETDSYQRIFLADIPGIIEGASRNRGLGFEFLRHIERNKLLLILLDASGIDGRTPEADFAVLRKEMKAYDPELLKKPFLVVLNKIDADEAREKADHFLSLKLVPKKRICLISAFTGEGLEELERRIVAEIGLL